GVPPGTLSITPSMADFGSVPIGSQSGAITFTVLNVGGVTVGPLAVSLSSSMFIITTNSCLGAMLAPGATCAIATRFAPTQVGLLAATLTVNATSSLVTANLVGTGIATTSLIIAPNPASFGNVPVGQLGPTITFTVTNPSGNPPTSL